MVSAVGALRAVCVRTVQSALGRQTAAVPCVREGFLPPDGWVGARPDLGRGHRHGDINLRQTLIGLRPVRVTGREASCQVGKRAGREVAKQADS